MKEIYVYLRTLCRKIDPRDVVVIVVIDEKTGKIVLVTDRNRTPPHLRKFPWGTVDLRDQEGSPVTDRDGAAQRTAIRRVAEQTGLTITAKTMRRVGIITETKTALYMFVALADFRTVAPQGRRGEEIHICTVEDLDRMEDFYRRHKIVLDRVLRFLR